eukprot:267059-Chlamydomonas_euryale.AAC.2
MRIAQLKRELADVEGDYEKEKLTERIAKLSGGVAVVKVWTVQRVKCLVHTFTLQPSLPALPLFTPRFAL